MTLPLKKAVLQFVQTTCLELLHIELDSTDDISDYLQYKADYASNLANQASVIAEIPCNILHLLNSICKDLQALTADKTAEEEVCDRKHEGKVGKSSYNVAKTTLDYYLSNCFTLCKIAALLNISESTVKRRMKLYGLSVTDTYSNLTDAELDQLVSDILLEFPNTGYRGMLGHLSQKGIRVVERRVRNAMKRVDPAGVLERMAGLQVLQHRVYHVAGPLRLWHMDGHHHLTRQGSQRKFKSLLVGAAFWYLQYCNNE